MTAPGLRANEMTDAFDGLVLAGLAPADVLIIVPPLAAIDLPSLAGHLLQACNAEHGISTAVFYANLALAHLIGEDRYESLGSGPELIGERFFAHVAYGKDFEVLFPDVTEDRPPPEPGEIPRLSMAEVKRLAAGAGAFVDTLARHIASRGYKVVGCSTTFEQTSASIAFLDRVKSLSPGVITVIGGANCEGPMGDGMAGLAPKVDYVFSGESETTFPAFLQQVLGGARPDQRLVRSNGPSDITKFPMTDYTEYFDQVQSFLGESETLKPSSIWLPYESSRGCWWGEKHQCTFCGLMGENIAQRSRDGKQVLEDFKHLLRTYPSRNIFAIDSIMPRSFFKTLLPELAKIDDLNLFYEQKSNLTRDNLVAMKRAGMNLIQPGIEALSTPLLKRMSKGVSGRQHLNLMRDAREVGVGLTWNLLYDFPGDTLEDYEQTVSYLPHLVHLYPPVKVQPLSLERFSPYFNEPGRYGVANVRPKPAYHEILPEGADVENIAYNFVGDFENASRAYPGVIRQMEEHVREWRRRWTSGVAVPALTLTALNDDSYLLLDSRYGKPQYTVLTHVEAHRITTERRVADCDRAEYAWALDRHLMLEVDAHLIPVVVRALDPASDAPGTGCLDPEIDAKDLAGPGGLPMPAAGS